MLEAEEDKKIIGIIIEMVRRASKGMEESERRLKELEESKKIGINHNI